MDKRSAGILGAKKQKELGTNVWARRHNVMLKTYNENPKLCQHCSKPIPYKKRINDFCSRSCAISCNNKGRSRNVSSGLYGKKQCLCCGTVTTNSKFCSQSCHKNYLYKMFIEDWLLGKNSGARGYTVSDHIKRWLKETRGNACEICGWAETNKTSKTIPIEVDHIDGNSRNNDPKNLRLLCPNCHSLTPTYGNLNKGNGRRYKHRKYMQT